MAFQYGRTTMFCWLPTMPTEWYQAASAVAEGDILIVDNSGSGAGEVKVSQSASASLASTGIEGGLIGVAMNAASAEGGAVQVALFTSMTGLVLPSKASTTASPSEATLGVAPTTLYVMYRESTGVWSADHDTTTNGVLRFLNLDPTDNVSQGTSGTQTINTPGYTFGGWTPTNTGGEATNGLYGIPPELRFVNM
jgi:hypothetical protein